jgi:uroporphyrinogen III methyltransferase/synthase
LTELGRNGKVFLVGAGPGDPGLMTVRGAQLLREADAVLADGLVNPAFRGWTRSDALWISVGKHGGDRLWTQAEINDAMVEQARQGRRVVRLKGGDTGVFARTAEELERLVAEGIPFEVVPGVTAALAVAAYTGIPITHRDWSSAVALVTGQTQAADGGVEISESVDWRALAEFPGTLILYMGVTSAPWWSRRLMEAGKSPSCPVALVRRCSWPDQQVVRCSLRDVGEHLGSGSVIRPPVLAIVGEVARLGESMDWFSQRPLQGKTILVSRGEGQASPGSMAVLEEMGARLIYQPGVVVEGLDDFAELDVKLQGLADLDWLVFASANGVDHFFRRLRELQRDARALGGCRLAGVGPSVAGALERWGVRCDLLPEGAESRWNAGCLADRMLAHFATHGLGKQRCLAVRANRGKATLEEKLRGAGHEVEGVVAYRSQEVAGLLPETLAAIEEGIDLAIVTSSANAERLAKLLGAVGHRWQWLAISPEVAKVLRSQGIEKIDVSAQSSLESLVELAVQTAVVA